MPLAFLEVKKPNNEGGIQQEFNRMINKRLQNPDYKKFFNMIQLVSFSNNMEYEEDDDIYAIIAILLIIFMIIIIVSFVNKNGGSGGNGGSRGRNIYTGPIITTGNDFGGWGRSSGGGFGGGLGGFGGFGGGSFGGGGAGGSW